MMALDSGVQNCGKMISVDSPAGGGKTFLLNLALAVFRGRGDVAIATATTGIAAMLLTGGGTAHSRFGIPVPVDASSVSNIKVASSRAEIIRKSAVIIWDEVTMADKFAIECVDRLLREIMSNAEVPFGGKLIVFSGARDPPKVVFFAPPRGVIFGGSPARLAPAVACCQARKSRADCQCDSEAFSFVATRPSHEAYKEHAGGGAWAAIE